jgi:hypothetical protein
MFRVIGVGSELPVLVLPDSVGLSFRTKTLMRWAFVTALFMALVTNL